MSKRKGLVCLLSTAILFTTFSFAATQDRVVGSLAAGQTVTLRGNVHPLAKPQFDLGTVDPAMPMATITLLTTPTQAQQQALAQLLVQQQNPRSSQYHKWLTPEAYANRFGLSKNDIQSIAAWLQSQGFAQIHTARGRNWVSFTGTAGQVQAAFGTEIHRYNVKGVMHYANATSPTIPAALSGVVVGFRGLHDFLPHAMNQKRVRPYYYSSTYGDFIAPGDLATIYDMNALYSAGVDGTGQKIAVMGQTQIYLADLNNFRTGFGLSSLNCTANTSNIITACSDTHFQYLVVPGTTPPLSTSGDIGEADLDLEWSGAVARGAQIIFVNSNNTFTSFYYAIDNNVAPVISLSYGECEFYDNTILTAPTGQTPDETELQKAASEGITFVNSSGDSGAAECDSSSTVTSNQLATQGLAVSFPASSPEVTGVGGTGVALAAWNSPTYWGTTNGTDGGSALSYVPEQVWNDDLEIFQFCQANAGNKFCTQGGTTPVSGWINITSESTAQNDIGISSTGGGASNCTTQNSGNTSCVSGYPKPSWQTVNPAGSPSNRLSPDISFFASPNFPGYVFCTPMSEISNSTSSASSCASGISTAVNTNLSIIGGTSASAPVFAGIVALLNQYLAGTSQAGLGNVNPTLYSLAATPANGAFHPVTSGDNYVSCVVGSPSGQTASLQCPASGVLGYSASTSDATTGYNLVAGLGSVDVNKLATAWAATRATTTTALNVSNASPYQGQSVTLTANVTPSTATGVVTFMNGSTTLGSSTLALGTATYQTSALPLGTSNVTAVYNGDVANAKSTSSASAVTVAQAFTLTPSATSYQVAQGSNVSATIALAFASGFSGTVTFTCNDTVAQSTCTAPPQTNAAGNVTFTVTTTAATAKLQRPMDRSTGIFFAALLPGLMGIVFTVGSRKRSLRGLLGLILVLGLSTVWMSSCGGNSNSGTTGNTGTPKGTYTINITGTSGTATANSSFQLVVQ